MFTNIERSTYRAKATQWDIPKRLEVIVEELRASGKAESLITPEELEQEITLTVLESIHEPEMIRAIQHASLNCKPNEQTITSYDSDGTNSCSVIESDTYESALWAAWTAILAAKTLTAGQLPITYSLSRPPGHHVGRDYYHGFGFFNNSAAAAHVLRGVENRVSILDIDAHHGDGTQDIFYEDPLIFFASLHANPDIVFPYTGKADEIGMGAGLDTTLNLPFEIGVSVEQYKSLLSQALKVIQDFSPRYLVLSAGFDTHVREYDNLPPLTKLDTSDYFDLGKMIGNAGLPICFILEGGYNTKFLGQSYMQISRGLEESLS